jgi:hypothetical protein
MAIASLYPSINPSLLLDFANTKQLDPRITFTRTTTATYYDGVTTAVAEQNLFLYSQQMDNASGWATNGITVTADNANAPDGTTTAELLTATSGTSGKLIQNGTLSPASSTTYTFSFFIKAGTHNFIQFMNANDAQAYANFNASTGALGNYGSNTTATITSVGNSWYRCVLTFSSAATLNSSFRWYMVASNTAAWASSLAAAGTETMYIWGAQAEQRSSATAYTATTTQAITNYIPVLQTASAGQARFDHNPTTGESLGLLIEEARTNSVTYSSDFSNAAWTKQGNTITSNTIIAPDGTLTGDKIVPASSQTYNQNYSSLTLLAGTNYAISCYAKKGEYSYLNLGLLFNTSNYAGAQFDLNAGSVLYTRASGSGYSVVSTSITPVGNGWYRCVVVATSSLNDIYPNVVASNSLWTSGYPDIAITGNGFSGIFIWGAQIEAGSFATSYIPTVASSVTRNADAASMTGTNFSSWFNNGEGTLYAEGIVSWGTNAYPRLVNINNGSTTQKIDILATSATSLYGAVTYNGSDVLGQTVTTTLSSSNKTAIAYAYNNGAFLVNSSSPTTDTSMNVPSVSQINIGATNSGFYANGAIKKISYYPIRVTNAQLQALTV